VEIGQKCEQGQEVIQPNKKKQDERGDAGDVEHDLRQVMRGHHRMRRPGQGKGDDGSGMMLLMQS
jgi:hypothetical protein